MSSNETLVPVMKAEAENIIAALLPGNIVQVCGPPMVGKSSLVDQALCSVDNQHKYQSHKFMCENKDNFQDVLNVMAETLGWQSDSDIPIANEELVLSLLVTTLGKSPTSHHVLVFHKCQGLQREAIKSDKDNMFVNFILRTVQSLSGTFDLSVVFTSSKIFPLKDDNTCSIEIGVLNFWDILSILQSFAPNVEVLSYVSVCLNTFPIPAAVKLFAEELLASDECPQPPEDLVERIVNDEIFLFKVFGHKLEMVEKWIPEDVLSGLVHFCQYLGSSFTEAHLKCVIADNKRHNWLKLLSYLKRNYIVWSVILEGINRLVVHPLVVYYWTHGHQHNQQALQGLLYDKSCNRFTDFLCRLLRFTEASIEKHSESGLVPGCLALEWPHVRHTVEMAIHCNEDTYKSFLKAAVSARGLISRYFNEEAIVMYQALYDCSKLYGTTSENAMVEAILGHMKASTFVLAKGGTWQQAENCLHSAIVKLRKNGPAYALMWAICRLAIILMRQGKYQESQMCFKAAKRVTVAEAGDNDPEDLYRVSKLQVKQEKITRDIYIANTLIFLGEHDSAENILLECLEFMQNEYADHPELATVLNSLGLVEERALCKKFLLDALNITRERGWVHTNTTLSLMHLGILNMRCGEFAQAYKNTVEADEIMQKIVKIHDTRLRLNNTLGHLRHLLEIDASLRLEEVKLEKCAEEYFVTAIEIGDKISGNLSDDGHHHLIVAHEHIMLEALGNSKEKYNSHKNAVLPYFQVSEGVGKKVFAINAKIPLHMDLYNYFATTDYEDIDKRIFLGHLVKACDSCKIIGPLITAEKVWCDVQQTENS